MNVEGDTSTASSASAPHSSEITLHLQSQSGHPQTLRDAVLDEKTTWVSYDNKRPGDVRCALGETRTHLLWKESGQSQATDRSNTSRLRSSASLVGSVNGSLIHYRVIINTEGSTNIDGWTKWNPVDPNNHLGTVVKNCNNSRLNSSTLRLSTQPDDEEGSYFLPTDFKVLLPPVSARIRQYGSENTGTDRLMHSLLVEVDRSVLKSVPGSSESWPFDQASYVEVGRTGTGGLRAGTVQTRFVGPEHPGTGHYTFD